MDRKFGYHLITAKGEVTCIEDSGEETVTSGDQGLPIWAGEEKSAGRSTGMKKRWLKSDFIWASVSADLIRLAAQTIYKISMEFLN